jgi:hypothetical protein
MSTDPEALAAKIDYALSRINDPVPRDRPTLLDLVGLLQESRSAIRRMGEQHPPTDAHDEFGYSLDAPTTAARVARSIRDLDQLHDQSKINGNEAEVLTSARQLIVTLAALGAVRPAPEPESPKVVHWVGDAPTSLHGNGASSFEHGTREASEVTCKLCISLLSVLHHHCEDCVSDGNANCCDCGREIGPVCEECGIVPCTCLDDACLDEFDRTDGASDARP